MIDSEGNIVLVDGTENEEKKVAELPLEYILLVALVDRIVKRSDYPKHTIVGLRDYVRRHRHDFEGEVEKVIMAYYETDPEAEAAEKSRRDAEKAARKAKREADRAKREAEIDAFFGLSK